MADKDYFASLIKRFKSRDTNELIQACKEAASHAGDFDMGQMEKISDALVSTFYFDTADHPELSGVIDAAVDALVALGPSATDVLISELTDTDLKANLLIIRTLSKMGESAYIALAGRFLTEKDPYLKSLALFGLSKMNDPGLLEIFPDVVRLLAHENPELRDTAARTVGKLVDQFPSGQLAEPSVREAFENLTELINDPNAGIRSKAVRTIGKLGSAKYLTMKQEQKAIELLSGLLGIDGKHEWDRAFIVRKEAEEAFENITGSSAGEVCS
ncbi:MAG: hypothetical protein ABIC40_01125 [bacterium]